MHSYVWHDSFICVTWLIHVCDLTHSCVWLDSFICRLQQDAYRNFLLFNKNKIRYVPYCRRTYESVMSHIWISHVTHMNESWGKTGVSADRDKIQFRLFNSSSIVNKTLHEELFSLPKKTQTIYSYFGFRAHNQGNSGLQLLSKDLSWRPLFPFMSHIWMRYVTHMDEPCHTYGWAMSHIWMSHVTHMDEPCHTYGWVMSHIWMSHVTHMDESCHTYGW